MNGRVYDPALGRMLSPDPVTSATGNAQAYNRYAYVLNNPLRFVDPSGYNAYDCGFWCTPPDLPNICVPCEVGFNVNSIPANWPYSFLNTIGTFNPNNIFEYGNPDPLGFANWTDAQWQALADQLNDGGDTNGEKPGPGEVVGELPTIFGDEKFLNVLAVALKNVKASVNEAYELLGHRNWTLGQIIRSDGLGGYVLSPPTPNSLVPGGTEPIAGFAGGQVVIQNAAAVVVSVPVHYRNGTVLSDAELWNKLARDVEAPVIVTGRRVEDIFVFTGNGEPVTFEFSED